MLGDGIAKDDAEIKPPIGDAADEVGRGRMSATG